MQYDFELAEGKFILAGDTRPRHPFEFFVENTRDMPQRIYAAIAAERPVAFFHLGDMVTLGSFDGSWRRTYDCHIRPVTEARIPVFPVIGNHEYKPIPSWGLANYIKRFPYLPRPHWYSVRAGRLLFLSVDSNFLLLSPARRAAQDQWLADTLLQAQKDPMILWVSVLLHHPPYTNVSPIFLVSANARVRKVWVPVFKNYSKTRLVFAGHIHSYERFQDNGICFIVSGGGGSPRFALRRPDRWLYDDIFTKTLRIRNFHYIRLTIQESGILTEMIQWDGSVWSVGDSFMVK